MIKKGETDMKKAEVVNEFFVSIFTHSQASHFSQVPDPLGRCGGSEAPPSVSEEQVQDHLVKLNSHKSMGPEEMHPRVLRELVSVVVKPLSIVFEKSWWSGEVLGDQKTGDITPIFKNGKKEDPGNYRPAEPENTMSQNLLEDLLKHIKDKEASASTSLLRANHA